MSVSRTQVVKFLKAGEKGEQGATLRGPQDWESCANGYSFQCGSPGEAWKDVVIYNDNFYTCIKSHTKTSSNYPGSAADTNNKFWRLGDKIEMVATKILLSTYALVKNLGVEAIEMKDSSGNIVFRAKDGEVTCKTGSFKDVDIDGNLTAATMRLKVAETRYPSWMLVNGSAIVGGAYHYLPKLEEGECMEIKWINPQITKLIITSKFYGEDSTVLISDGKNRDTASRSYTTDRTGYFEIFGVRDVGSSYTYWHIFPLSPEE